MKKLARYFVASLTLFVLSVSTIGSVAGCAFIDKYAANNKANFVEAIAYGDFKTANSLLENGADANARIENDYRVTVLMVAAVFGQTETARILLFNGAEVNARNDYGTTALMYAAAGCQTSMINLLLSAGADVNARNNSAHSALDMAKNCNCDKEIIEMLEKGKPVTK